MKNKKINHNYFIYLCLKIILCFLLLERSSRVSPVIFLKRHFKKIEKCTFVVTLASCQNGNQVEEGGRRIILIRKQFKIPARPAGAPNLPTFHNIQIA